MAFCYVCGEKLSSGQKFFSKCGGVNKSETQNSISGANGGKVMFRIPPTSKLPIILIAIVVVSILCSGSYLIFNLSFYWSAAQIVFLLPTIILASLSFTQAKKRLSVMIVPVALGTFVPVFEPFILGMNGSKVLLVLLVSIVTLCLFCLTIYGKIKQKIPVIISITILIVLTVLIAGSERYGISRFGYYLLIYLPQLLFFVSMLILVLSLEKYIVVETGGKEYELFSEKSIAMCIFLSFITFDIYQLFWIYTMCKKIKLLNNDTTSCVGEFLCLVFVPFYSLYWVYTRAKKLSDGANKRGILIQNNSTVCLIVSILGLGIVSYALIQNSLNEIALQLTTPSGSRASNTVQMASTVKPTTDTSAYSQANNHIETIKQLSELHKQGILTDEEFEEKKKTLLNKI